jgi:catechol 2,3-dioxygenase-like lactoylglutathione lyase family enzyme
MMKIKRTILLLACLAFYAAAQNQTDPPARPLIVGVAHIAFQVSDIAKARDFYGGLLGYEEPFQLINPNGSLALTYFKVNDRQYIEIFPGLPADQDERLKHIAFETTDIEALRVYLKSKGLKVPDKHGQGRDGNFNFTVTDPDNHIVEFVQYRPGSLHTKARGKYMSAQRISDRILHVGVTVSDAAAADRFYKEILGFAETWRGGRDDNTINWINMKVPDGTDYIEYMLTTGKPTRQKALQTARQRVDDPAKIRSPQVGRNRRWQLNLFDPDGSRAELMEPFTMR